MAIVQKHWSPSDSGAAAARPSLDAQAVVRHEWTIASDIREIEPLVSSAVRLCADAGMEARACCLRIPVALTEALSNAIMCGNENDSTRHVVVALSLDAKSLQLDITDEGDGFDVDAAMSSPDDCDWLEREDGRGLFLMRSLMDRVELQCPTGAAHGHTVRLVLNRS